MSRDFLRANYILTSLWFRFYVNTTARYYDKHPTMGADTIRAALDNANTIEDTLEQVGIAKLRFKRMLIIGIKLLGPNFVFVAMLDTIFEPPGLTSSCS